MELVNNTGGHAVTMTSLELVDFINSQRGLEEAELTHANFLAKVPKVLGETSHSFECDLPDSYGRPRRGYRFLKREACLMAMSYSYELQAKVFDRMTELEQLVDQPKVPQTMPEALRLAAEAIEQRDLLALQNKVQAEALAVAEPKAQALDLIAAGEKAVTIREAAKLLDVKEAQLTGWLHQHGWTYRLNGRWVARQEHIQGGRLVYKEARYTDQRTGQEVYAPYCHITPKGLAKLAHEFQKQHAKAA